MLPSITTKAQEHFQRLMQDQEHNTAIRLNVDQPMTEYAEIELTFCPSGKQEEDDIRVNLENLIFYVAKRALNSLKDAVIDFVNDDTGGQLQIKAPYIKGKVLPKNATLQEKVEYIINNEINPSLEQHNGMVSVVEITKDKEVIVKFSGGCHGCSMAKVTLKQTIEAKLLASLPEISAVIDSTEHAMGASPYC